MQLTCLPTVAIVLSGRIFHGPAQLRKHISSHNLLFDNASLPPAQRFPQWMWRNRPVEQFVSWLHNHNLLLTEAERVQRGVGVYGMGARWFM